MRGEFRAVAVLEGRREGGGDGGDGGGGEEGEVEEGVRDYGLFDEELLIVRQRLVLHHTRSTQFVRTV